MTDRAALLEYASDLLDGSVALGARGIRTAALLARRAFEDWLDEQGAQWSGSSYYGPSTKSKLVILEALRGTELGQSVKRIWQGLSVACHHHSYELQPSSAEVKDLVEQVRGLDDSGQTV
ncbi:hypothetical protein [Mycobacterium sp.]|uniref:hypothetical protein n=1 Tax=Mycobacterium sp. TaxID=1785 RepID=UPI003BAE59A5